MSTLQRFSGLYNVDAILLTHLHCDHMLDACSYVVVRRYSPDGPWPRLPLFAPKGAQTRMMAAYGMPDAADPLAFLLELNLACAAKEKAGEKITPPGLPLPREEQQQFVTEDCIAAPTV